MWTKDGNTPPQRSITVGMESLDIALSRLGPSQAMAPAGPWRCFWFASLIFLRFCQNNLPSEPPRSGAASQPWALKGAALITHQYGMCVVCFDTLCTFFLKVVMLQEPRPCPQEPGPPAFLNATTCARPNMDDSCGPRMATPRPRGQ